MDFLFFAIATALVLVLGWAVLLWIGFRLLAVVMEELKRQDYYDGWDDDA